MDLEVGATDLLGGGDGLLVGVANLTLGVGLEFGTDKGLPLDCNVLVPDRGDGLKRFGLALPLLLR